MQCKEGIHSHEESTNLQPPLGEKQVNSREMLWPLILISENDVSYKWLNFYLCYLWGVDQHKIARIFSKSLTFLYFLPFLILALCILAGKFRSHG